MDQVEPPEWMQGWAPAPPKAKPERRAPAWVKGMPSPNKAGRPKGIVDRRAKIADRMLADAESIVSTLIEQALEGDTGAAGLILSRCVPALRNQTEKVQFPFDPTANTAEQIEAVIAAIASGAVSADVGREVITAIGTLSNARVVEELESRIITLEAKQI